MAFLSMRQYAKHRGVSTEAVSKAVKKGRITCTRTINGVAQIDPDVADRQWDQNTEGIRPNYGIPHTPAQPQQEEPGGAPTVQQAARILKTYQAKLARLEFEEKAARLHDVEKCKRDAFKIARTIRDALLGVPDRLCAELAGEADQFKIRQRLEDEIRQALESIADQITAEPSS